MIRRLTQFAKLKLSEPTLKAIEEMEFVYATEIQSKTIPLLLHGKDIIGQAGTGTGKTAAFAIPIIEKIDADNNNIQALVLCPTRELVVQVTEQFTKLMKYHKDLSVVAIYGGQNISTQLKALKQGVQIVVGTPGRIMDHMRRGSLKLQNLQFLTLDEADQMLDMGFREDIETILQDTPKTRQTVMFSATMSRDILKLTQKYQNKPEHINVVSDKEQSVQINQVYFEINNKSKVEALKRVLALYDVKSALIFCNTKAMVDDLSTMLRSKKYNAAGLHGDMDQRKRDSVMNGFRKEQIQLLIATDVAARGIDVNNIEAVFNFDLPRDGQDYVHRIGRTGRAGKAGLAFSFVVGKEVDQLRRIAKFNNLKVESAKVPTIEDLEASRLKLFTSSLQDDHLGARLQKKYLKYIEEWKEEGQSVEEITATLLKKLMDQEVGDFDSTVEFSPEKYSSQRREGKGKSNGYRGSNDRKDFGSRSGPRSGSRSGFGSRSGGSQSRSSSGSQSRSGSDSQSRSGSRSGSKSSSSFSSKSSFGAKSSSRPGSSSGTAPRAPSSNYKKPRKPGS